MNETKNACMDHGHNFVGLIVKVEHDTSKASKAVTTTEHRIVCTKCGESKSRD